MGETTRVYLVRHGQTEWNKVERYRGTIDVPLNDVGRGQARALARRLQAEKDVVAVYSSSRGRALDTARPIAEVLGLPVQALAGIDDVSFGEWEGHTPAEVDELWPELHRRWQLAPHTVQFPGGDSLATVRARAGAALAEAVARHAGQALVLVTHKVVCKVLLCATLGLDDAHYWQVEMDNASFSLLEHVDGLYVLATMNDTCHLRGE
ncbi:MAG: histidine phosphatase family protein [Chloroflexi bacterium]|nr:histidine phosphatase family protein [Chloroflexota bacterium]